MWIISLLIAHLYSLSHCQDTTEGVEAVLLNCAQYIFDCNTELIWQVTEPRINGKQECDISLQQLALIVSSLHNYFIPQEVDGDYVNPNWQNVFEGCIRNSNERSNNTASESRLCTANIGVTVQANTKTCATKNGNSTTIFYGSDSINNYKKINSMDVIPLAEPPLYVTLNCTLQNQDICKIRLIWKLCLDLRLASQRYQNTLHFYENATTNENQCEFSVIIPNSTADVFRELDALTSSILSENEEMYGSPMYHIMFEDWYETIMWCFEETRENNGVIQKWCKTAEGTTVYPCESPCVDDKGTFITRTCQKHPRYGAIWSEISDTCSNATYSEVTNVLNIAKNNVTESTLEIVADATKNTTLKELDIERIGTILDKYTKVKGNRQKTQKHFFNTVNNLLNTNRSVFRNTRKFGSTDKILKFIDKYLVELSQEITNPVDMSFHNFAFRISKPTNIIGDNYNVSLNGVSASIPSDLNMTSILTVFEHDNLFPEGDVGSSIIDLNIPGANGDLKNTISIYLHPTAPNEFTCSFWKVDDNKIGNWSSVGVETIRINDDVIECRTTHLTAFALLGISDKIINKLSDENKLALRIISTILCILSLIGLSLIFITCFSLKHWYKKRINSIQLCVVVTLEIFMLTLDDTITINDGLNCVLFGIILHYLVLTKFMLMLLIARMQYINFVIVLTSRSKNRNILLNASLNFSIPIVIVGISAGIFSNKYKSGDVQFCYPKEEAFTYFLVVPVSLILLANIIIFSLVMFKISKSLTRDSKQKTLQLKLAIMLFFMLGLTWLFSTFSQIVSTQWLQYFFIYAFTILAPLQGFVIFLFSVVMDLDARRFWMITFNNLKYTALEKQSITSNTISTGVTFSSNVQSHHKQDEIETSTAPNLVTVPVTSSINEENDELKGLTFTNKQYTFSSDEQPQHMQDEMEISTAPGLVTVPVTSSSNEENDELKGLPCIHKHYTLTHKNRANL